MKYAEAFLPIDVKQRHRGLISSGAAVWSNEKGMQVPRVYLGETTTVGGCCSLQSLEPSAMYSHAL